MRKELLLLAILSTIILILLAILIFVPSKNDNSDLAGQEGIQVFLPKANDSVSLPIEITGVVTGNGWAGFEGQVGTVKLMSGGQVLAQTFLQATSDWMALPTTFRATLSQLLVKCGPQTKCMFSGDAQLVFHNENASGMPEKDKTFILPIKINNTLKETLNLKVFFGNMALSASAEEDECKRVYEVDRYVEKTEAVATFAIGELLKGPTESEKNQGYFSSIPSGSKLNSISIKEGIAYIDFDQTTESGGGSCSMASRVAQITQTLKQFPTIKNVIISINGRTQDIFQP